MSKPQAMAFYSSKEWRRCREAYRKSVGGLCERCLAHGMYSPGEIVHHKIHIDPDNMTDPDILLCFDNLELLCRNCHAEAHAANARRYKIDEFGNVLIPPV